MVGSFIYVPSNSVFIALSDYTINCDPNPSQEPHSTRASCLSKKSAKIRPLIFVWFFGVCFLLLLFLLSLFLVVVVYATETLFQHHHQHHHQVVENGK